MTLLIHPGMHKTGTTWLQERVFSDPRLFTSLMTHREVFDTFARPHDFDFSVSHAKFILEQRRQVASSERVEVISSETLCGNPLLGQTESRRIADRLAAVVGQAKILITVREQRATIKALYYQYVKRGGRKSISDYLNYVPEPGYYTFDKRQLAYSRLVCYYAELFGDENILVLPQEALARSPGRYFERLIVFATGNLVDAGVEPPDRTRIGASPPASGLPLLRFSSHFRRLPMNHDPVIPWEWFGWLLAAVSYRWTLGNHRARKRIDDIVGTASTGLYGQSNKELQRFCPFDLSSLGYEVAERP